MRLADSKGSTDERSVWAPGIQRARSNNVLLSRLHVNGSVLEDAGTEMLLGNVHVLVQRLP